MYHIIGTDGREYGPVNAEQLKQWIAEHRVNGQTKVRMAESADWKTLAEFPEFAANLTAPPAPPAPPPFRGSAEAEALTQQLLASDYQLEVGRCISRGWDLVMANFWLTVGASALILIISIAVSAIPFGSLVLTYVFWGGLDWLLLKRIRGERAEVGDAFAGFSLAFVPLMLFSIVGQLLTAVGLLLCILPGVYLTIAWMMFTPLLIIDKRLDFWPAMELSRKVVTRHWWAAFGLFLLSLIICFAGVLACAVGLFIALPVTAAAIVFAYEDMFCRKSDPALSAGAAGSSNVAPSP
jgi:hypothetical protein